MCEPATLATIAIASTAAGTAAQIAGQRKSKKAMEGAAAAERIRQKGFRDESNAVFDQSLSKQGAETQKQGMTAAEAKRAQVMTEAQSAAPVADVASKNGAPTIVADETAARVAAGNTAAGLDAANRAALASFGDVQLGNALANIRTNQSLAQLSNFSRGSTDVLGLEMEAARNKGAGLIGIGQGLTAIGSVAGLGAGMGGFQSLFGSTAGAAASAAPAVPAVTGATTNVLTTPSMTPSIALGNIDWGIGSEPINLTGRSTPGFYDITFPYNLVRR